MFELVLDFEKGEKMFPQAEAFVVLELKSGAKVVGYGVEQLSRHEPFFEGGHPFIRRPFFPDGRTEWNYTLPETKKGLAGPKGFAGKSFRVEDLDELREYADEHYMDIAHCVAPYIMRVGLTQSVFDGIDDYFNLVSSWVYRNQGMFVMKDNARYLSQTDYENEKIDLIDSCAKRMMQSLDVYVWRHSEVLTKDFERTIETTEMLCKSFPEEFRGGEMISIANCVARNMDSFDEPTMNNLETLFFKYSEFWRKMNMQEFTGAEYAAKAIVREADKLGIGKLIDLHHQLHNEKDPVKTSAIETEISIYVNLPGLGVGSG
ncbi:MAG: hypothetical protein GY861_24795 [bacterium]|nr:hypothetical protein [bacterium]